MVSLRRDSNGNFIARKRLPDDVRAEYGQRHKARYEAKFFARASLGKQIAQERFHLWAAEVDQRIEAIRKARRGEGIDIDREQAAALAGEWYLWFVAKYEKEDADPEAYEVIIRLSTHIIMGGIFPSGCDPRPAGAIDQAVDI
jgi:hypothetical protein